MATEEEFVQYVCSIVMHDFFLHTPRVSGFRSARIAPLGRPFWERRGRHMGRLTTRDQDECAENGVPVIPCQAVVCRAMNMRFPMDHL